MHLSTFLSALTVLSSLSLISADHNPPHRRHLARSPRLEKRYDPIVGRAGGPISNDTIESISMSEWSSQHPSATPTESASAVESAVATSSGDEPSGQRGDTIAPITSTSSSVVPVETSSEVTPSSTIESIVQPSSTVESSIPPPSSALPSSTPIANAPSTISISSSRPSSTVVTRSERVSVVTATITSSTAASAGSSNQENSEEKKGGLSKTALIVIIVLASVVGVAVIAVFAIRKWKLRPSNRFDERMKPIDFSPSGNDGMDDVFLEKTLQRTMSNDMADQQRRQFVKELEAEPNYVAGIPEHDFTAGTNAHYDDGMGYDRGMYNSDPFAHAQAFEYDDTDHQYASQQSMSSTIHYPPPSAGHVEFPNHPNHQTYQNDYPTQDDGYADLQRGNSNGSDHRPQRLSGGSGSAHGHVHGGQVYPDEFPSADQYIGRPTGGVDGPYAQAAQYRY